MDISDWSDLRQFDDDGNFNFGSNNSKDNEERNEDKGNNKDASQEKGSQKTEEGGGGAEESDVYSGFEVTDWNDLRKFDDDHDDDWFKCQEKKLTEQYGGNFIKVKYSNNGRVAYFCELCLAECNAKKSLELHCAGMKHLRKKDLWEKAGKPHPPTSVGTEISSSGEKSKERKGTNSPPPPMRKRLGRAGIGYGGRSRSRERMPPYDRREPPRRYGGDYGRDEAPPLFSADRYHPRERFYDSHDHRDRETGGYGPPPPGNGGYDEMSPYDRHDTMGSRGSQGMPRYSPRRDRGFSPPSRRDYDHGRDKKYPDYDDNRRRSPVRPRYYGDRRSGSRDRKRSPYGSRNERTRSPYGSRNKKSSRSKSPYKVEPPSPPKISSSRSNDSDKKVNLASSPAGSLLQKLAECCVKSSEDADLALNVVAALTKSLKEYCQRNEETKLAELLMEAELKVGTVKALKAGMKMLSNFTSDAGAGVMTPGSMFPTYLGLSQPPPSHSQTPNPPPVQYPRSAIQSGHYNY